MGEVDLVGRLRQHKDYIAREAADEVERLQEALQHGPKIGSVVVRGDPSEILQIVNTYIKDGHLVVIVDPPSNAALHTKENTNEL